MILLSKSGVLDTERLLDSISLNVLMIGLCIFVVYLSSFTVNVYERLDALAETQSFQRRHCCQNGKRSDQHFEAQALTGNFQLSPQ
jgi:hypothetical protein